MKLWGLVLTLLLILLISGCGLEASGLGPGRTIWLDGPVETEATVGMPVAITVHANFEISEVVIGYNLVGYSNVPLKTIPVYPIGANMYEAIDSWIPEEAGEYNLRAYTMDGVISHGRYVRVLPSFSPPIYDMTPTSSASGMTYVSLTVGTPLPAVAGQVQFFADRYELTAGECTFLRWASVYVDAVYLDDSPVELMHSKEVCPSTTTTYTLRGEYTGGSAEKTLTISVAAAQLPTTQVPAADTQGPVITGITKLRENIFDGTGCGETSNTISAGVSDPSGVSSVTLWYRAIKTTPAQTGEWRSISMTKSGSTYQAVLGIAELSSSLGLYADGTVEFYISTRDGKGNESQSSIKTFTTTMCFG
jgi:hypothetical protein